MKNDNKSNNIWDGFKVEHEEKKDDSMLVKILILVFVVVVGAALGALAATFFYYGPRHMRFEKMMNDTMSSIQLRWVIGAVIGALVSGGFVIKTLFLK